MSRTIPLPPPLRAFGAGYRANFTLVLLLLLFSLALQPSAGYGLLVSRGFLITHDAPQSVGFLWTIDQLGAETST
jgi:hypothetical protein